MPVKIEIIYTEKNKPKVRLSGSNNGQSIGTMVLNGAEFRKILNLFEKNSKAMANSASEIDQAYYHFINDSGLPELLELFDKEKFKK